MAAGQQRGAVWVHRGAANCSPAGVEVDVLLIAALQEWKRMVRAEIRMRMRRCNFGPSGFDLLMAAANSSLKPHFLL